MTIPAAVSGTCALSAPNLIFTVDISDSSGAPQNDCETAVLAITSLHSDLSVTVLDPETTLVEIDDDNDVSSTATDPALCGVLVKEFWDVSRGVEAALDLSMFSQVDSLTGTSLTAQTDDLDKVGSYRVRLIVFYRDFPDVAAQKDFAVEV